jgi:hypothetical protein
VIFSYTHRDTEGTDKRFVRGAITEEFPFLLTKTSPPTSTLLSQSTWRDSGPSVK